MCNYSNMIYAIHWNRSEQDKYAEQLITMLPTPRKLVLLHKASTKQLERGLPLSGGAKFSAATSAKRAVDRKTDSLRIHLQKLVRLTGSWLTADRAKVADLIWRILTWFLNLLRWDEPYLNAISPSIKYSVTRSAHGGVKIKFGSSRMHAPKYSREINSVSKFIHMMNGARGISAGQPMHDVVIIDSGSPFHCTGGYGSLSDYTELPSDRYICGASGTRMRVHGVGSIRNHRFQLQDVHYVPGLNRPNINMTIISVNKLAELGYRVIFDATSCSVIDNRKRTWTWQHDIVGAGHIEQEHYMLDYLRIPLNRAPLPRSPEGPGLVKRLWNAALKTLEYHYGREPVRH